MGILSAHRVGQRSLKEDGMTQEYMTEQEAADYLRSSPSTLAKLRLDETGPNFCRIGTAIRYRRTELDDWMNRRRAPSKMEGAM